MNPGESPGKDPISEELCPCQTGRAPPATIKTSLLSLRGSNVLPPLGSCKLLFYKSTVNETLVLNLLIESYFN